MWFFKSPKIQKAPRDMISIRMEAIGGQGANSAGKILAEAAVIGHGFTGNHFSSFGSEKRGSPVRSFVRFSTQKKQIRTASAITNPDLLVIFHESLIYTHPDVLDGVTEKTDLIINSAYPPKHLKLPSNINPLSVTTLNATALAVNSDCGLNAVMLGAISELCTEVDIEVLKKTMNDFFIKLSPQARKNNLLGFEKAAKNISTTNDVEHSNAIEFQTTVLPEMGWMNAPLGGVIINPGNSVLKDHSASRKGVAPQLIKEICFNCGFCDMVCPDYCFVWKIDPDGKHSPELQGIDYQYCKGCQKCITVCPVKALVPVQEDSLTREDKIYHVFPELSPKAIESQWKQFDWAHYVEELSTQKQMMTLQTELLNPNSYIRPDFSEVVFTQDKLQDKKGSVK